MNDNLESNSLIQSSSKRQRLDFNSVNISQMMETMQCNLNEFPAALDKMELQIQRIETTLGKAVDIETQKSEAVSREVTQMQNMQALSMNIDNEVNSGVLAMCEMYIKITQECMKNQFQAAGLTLK